MWSLAIRLLGFGGVTALYLWNTTVGVVALAVTFGYVLAQWTWKGETHRDENLGQQPDGLTAI